jgi:ABC-type polysaccharide/polyol phosphate transport system ATPase subunit
MSSMVAEEQGSHSDNSTLDNTALENTTNSFETTSVERDTDSWLIRASGLRKKYCRDLRRSLWYSLVDVMGAFGRKHESAEILREHEFWAVDDISFELRRGDSMGLLGRNGAGKSTLIKLITGQRSLTAGKVEMRGRVVALTELGLGFDPVLTGRENAYVNAAVHGVTRRDFEKLIEKIIEFSELREFIDSAVHTYSSGMKARLGFSVATHLNPDILIVDEVLAVGDLEFRRKCVQHVIGYLKAGGSVMLVAHDPYLVQSICNRTIVMERGRVVFDGSALEGVDLHFRMGHANQYAQATKSKPAEPAELPAPETDDALDADAVYSDDLADTGNGTGKDRTAEDVAAEALAARNAIVAAGNPYQSFQIELTESRPVVIDGISVVPVEGQTLLTGRPAKVSFHCRSLNEAEVGWGFTICTRDLQMNIASCAMGFDGESVLLKPGENTISCILPQLVLQAGVYAIRGGIGDSKHQTAIAAWGYEESPHFFTVSKPVLTKVSNWQVMMDDLIQMDVEWHSNH